MRSLFTAILPLASIAFAVGTVSGCTSTAGTGKVQVSLPNPQKSPTFLLMDERPLETRLYRQTGNTQYLGDSNFGIPPVQLVTTRFNEKLGNLLGGKEITLLDFQARISTAHPQTYPGMPLASEVLGRNFGLPQLGNPNYANVSIRGHLNNKEFSGSKSIPFYFGSGKDEVAAAMNVAIDEAIANLHTLLINDVKNP